MRETVSQNSVSTKSKFNSNSIAANFAPIYSPDQTFAIDMHRFKEKPAFVIENYQILSFVTIIFHANHFIIKLKIDVKILGLVSKII